VYDGLGIFSALVGSLIPAAFVDLVAMLGAIGSHLACIVAVPLWLRLVG
jgi:hypothetical protein